MTDKKHLETQKKIERWLDETVIGLNLCPFAKQPRNAGRIAIEIVSSNDEDAIYEHFLKAVYALLATPIEEVETTLLVLQSGFEEFEDYLDLLDQLETLIDLNEWRGTFQIASFHPHYQFEGTQPNSRENYTNRSPFPVFHLLREDSVSKARLLHPDTEAIPERNIALLEDMADARFDSLFLNKRK